MIDDRIVELMIDLRNSIDRQTEVQESTNTSIRSLTEMTGHLISAIKEHTELLDERSRQPIKKPIKNA